MTLYGGATTEERRKTLEQRITASRLLEMFDDDGDGLLASTDLETLEAIMADADDVVSGILIKKGYNEDQLAVLGEDRQVMRAWAGIAAQLAGERKPEWLDANGRGPFEAFGQRGREDLRSLARGDLRSVQEDVVGATRAVSASSAARPLYFAGDPDDPCDRGKGGF